MFLHLSVILFTGGCVSQHAMGQTPPRHTPLVRHPPGADTPWADIPLGRHLPPLSDTTGNGEQVVGTHPTGMHTCFPIIFVRNDPVKQYVEKLLSNHLVETNSPNCENSKKLDA